MSEAGERETMRAELKPDCYGGETCDKIVPRWWCYADGDKDGDYEHGAIQLGPRSFPPGTRISVIEPTCPDCGELREQLKHSEWEPGVVPFKPHCRCGFDWENWTLGKYS